jgi:hypothetical protein
MSKNGDVYKNWNELMGSCITEKSVLKEADEKVEETVEEFEKRKKPEDDSLLSMELWDGTKLKLAIYKRTGFIRPYAYCYVTPDKKKKSSGPYSGGADWWSNGRGINPFGDDEEFVKFVTK